MLPYGCIWILSTMCTCGVACVLTQIPAGQESVICFVLFFGLKLMSVASSDSTGAFSSHFLLLYSLKCDETGSESCCLER